MAYERKTIDTWELQLNYGYGWGVHLDRIHKERGKGEIERIQREPAAVPGTTG